MELICAFLIVFQKVHHLYHPLVKEIDMETGSEINLHPELYGIGVSWLAPNIYSLLAQTYKEQECDVQHKVHWENMQCSVLLCSKTELNSILIYTIGHQALHHLIDWR